MPRLIFSLVPIGLSCALSLSQEVVFSMPKTVDITNSPCYALLFITVALLPYHLDVNRVWGTYHIPRRKPPPPCINPSACLGARIFCICIGILNGAEPGTVHLKGSEAVLFFTVQKDPASTERGVSHMEMRPLHPTKCCHL